MAKVAHAGATAPERGTSGSPATAAGPSRRSGRQVGAGLLAAAALIAAVVAVASGATNDDRVTSPGSAPTAEAVGVSAPASSAIAELEARTAADPTDLPAWQELSRRYLQQAITHQRPRLLRPRPAIPRRLPTHSSPGDHSTMVTEGVLALSLHDFRRALELGQAAHEQVAEDPDPLSILIDATVELGRYDQAEAHVAELLAAPSRQRGALPPVLPARAPRRFSRVPAWPCSRPSRPPAPPRTEPPSPPSSVTSSWPSATSTAPPPPTAGRGPPQPGLATTERRPGPAGCRPRPARRGDRHAAPLVDRSPAPAAAASSASCSRRPAGTTTPPPASPWPRPGPRSWPVLGLRRRPGVGVVRRRPRRPRRGGRRSPAQAYATAGDRVHRRRPRLGADQGRARRRGAALRRGVATARHPVPRPPRPRRAGLRRGRPERPRRRPSSPSPSNRRPGWSPRCGPKPPTLGDRLGLAVPEDWRP